MKVLTVKRESLAEQLGYRGPDGEVSARAVANLLRAPLLRWGLSLRRDVLNYAREQLRVGGVEETNCASQVLERLIEVGDCAEIFVGHEPYLAPTMARWIKIGDEAGVYLGSGEPPGSLESPAQCASDLVRRIRMASEEDAVSLEVAGVREWSLREWLTPLDYLKCAARRQRALVSSQEMSLAQFWEMLEGELNKAGHLLTSDAKIRALCGSPGGYFGRYDADGESGRWTSAPGDGVWCGYRQGYGDAHWHPCIISVAGEARRMLDLYDVDEWRWALLARGRSVGEEEVVVIEDTEVKLTYPPPSQLRAALDILGVRRGAWTWELSPGAPDLWEHVR